MNASELTLTAGNGMRRLAALAVLATLSACAGYAGLGLQPGEARLADVEKRLGKPALRWQEPDGTQRLVYPRGPLGFHTYMAHIAADGRLLRIENVLDEQGFAAIRPGMSKDEVLRAIGPPDPSATMYFAARDELVWDWRYCDTWSSPARFYVLFDGSSGKVRSTMSQRESLLTDDFDARRFCGR
jgi:hypothetical protein